jgi:8-oxo-dGTP diphosphatase
MMYRERPADFNSRFEIVSCYVEHGDRFILLRRQLHKSQGGRWGLPAGKAEPGEDLREAMVREIKEETGLEIPKEHLNYFDKTFHHHPECDFVYHMFSTKLDALPDVKINPGEHQGFIWCMASDLLAMPKESIVEDLDDVTKLFYKLGT